MTVLARKIIPNAATPAPTNWTLDDIAWDQFDATKVDKDIVSLAKAACMVEHNGYDYARYLKQVFKGDAFFEDLADQWAEEEVRHGRALRKWVELADPTFNFDESFKTFTEGYQLPLDVEASVRGSKAGELIARCIVEIGTSTYYTAIRDSTTEPVMRDICAKISTDEIKHYMMFHAHAQDYLKQENVNEWGRLKIALSRIAESEDDELAYAYYAAHLNDIGAPQIYDHKSCKQTYLAKAYAVYQKQHITRMIVLLFKAIGLKQRSWLNKLLSQLMWSVMQFRLRLAR